MNHPPVYSIIIPAYNEAARIGRTLNAVVTCILRQGWNAEVLVVNDGSQDTTAALVSEYATRHTMVRLIENPSNRGKGYSIRNGVMHARGEILMFTDADLSAPMEEAELLFKAIYAGADVAIGSRWLDSHKQTIRQPIHRRIFGRCFNAITRLVMGLPYADTQCGFKAFTREAALTLFQLQRIDRWGFDPELLFIARLRHYRVMEVPVTWGHDERSRLSYLKDGLKMLEEMAYVRWNAFSGVYDRVTSNIPRESIVEG